MIYSREVEEMCPVAQGVHHGAAPIPEEAKWVKSKEIKDISGLTHGVGWCAPQQGACKLTLNVKEGIIQEALVETGRTRMRPILMTMLTTVLAMCTMVFSTDAAAEMSRGMAIVVIGGLLYATLMTLFVVPVLYDILFRREVKRVEIGDEELLDEK